jgi:hypothetical protein
MVAAVRALHRIENRLAAFAGQGAHVMAMIDDVSADVEAQSTVIASVETLLTNLSAQLAAAGTDPAKLQAIKDSLDANTARLSAAVVANTPAG